MKKDCSIDLVFISTNLDAFHKEVDFELYHLFQKYDLHWYLTARKEKDMHIVTAEIRGLGIWSSETALLTFMEQEANPEFWDWLQGYHLQVHSDGRKGRASNA